MKLSRVGTSVAMTAIAALALAGCAGDSDTASTTDSTDATSTGADSQGLSGELNATGASSQELAQLNGWIPGFTATESDVTVNYTATGSGTGRDNFVAGTSDFIGSDRAFDLEELESETFPICVEGTDLVEFPAYISPIAVAYNLPSVEELNLDATVLSGIFAGEITTWNDPAIAELNPDAELPDTAINAVHRGDASGTTGNFLSYLESAAPEAWTHGSEDEFPADLGGEAAQQTAGVAAAIAAGEGSIGYLDASQASDLQVAAIASGDGFVAYTPEAAAAVVAGSPLEEGRAESDVVFDLDYTGVEGGYPIVLVSYLIGCADYQDDAKAELVKAYFSYVVSEEGQDAAVAAAQNAPLSEELRTQAQAAIDTIQ